MTVKPWIKKILKALLIIFLIVILLVFGAILYFNAKINHFKKTLDLDEKKLIELVDIWHKRQAWKRLQEDKLEERPEEEDPRDRPGRPQIA